VGQPSARAERGVATLVDAVEERLRAQLLAFEPQIERIRAIAERPIPLDQYLIYSTVLSVFLIVFWMHKGVDIFVGYPIVLLNTMILFVQGRLVMHRYHALAVLAVTVLSFVASANSDTPGIAIIAQVLGILLFSSYFFTMLTNFGLSVPRWMQIYCQFALAIVILGFIIFILRQLHLMPRGREGRLRSIYPEPSLFVYVTLPAFGIYANAYLRDKKYKLELWIFIIAYILADSSLGFLGMLLVAFFAALPRLSFFKMMGFGAAAFTALVGLFFASQNFRSRVVDTLFGLINMNFNVNASSFAFLSNAYVAVQTFLTHPLFGVGLGGYQYAYMKYVPFLSVDLDNPDLISLNMFDASSLYFRTAAELGLVGLVGLFGFLIICSRVRGDQHVDIRNALMPYVIVRMSRYGAWFSLELYFFLGLLLLNYLHSRAQHGQPAAAPPLAAPPSHI
jgi:hypothetical protein